MKSLKKLLTLSLTVAVLAMSFSGCSDSDSDISSADLTNRLYVVAAESGTLTPTENGAESIITLNQVWTDVLWFTDRPQRETGEDTTEDFVQYKWPLVYGDIAPNAVIKFFVSGANAGVFVALKAPEYDSSTGILKFQGTLLNSTFDEPPQSSLEFDTPVVTILNNVSGQAGASSFVIYGESASIDVTSTEGQYTLIQEELDNSVLLANNAPGRHSNVSTTDAFVAQWNGIFGDSAPNAVISGLTDTGELYGYLLTLSEPTYEEALNRITYPATVLGQETEIPSTLTYATLVLDSADTTTEDSPLVITITNNSGFEDTQVYLLCTGSNQPGQEADNHFGYLNFSNHTFVETGPKSSFVLNASTMTATLNTIKNYSGDNTYKIQIPKIVSGRLYFAFGDNFDQCPSFSASGPPNSANNTVVYDKVEFDTWSNPNINITNVDFFGISYYVTVTDKNTGAEVQRGYLTSKEEVYDAFANIAGDTTQQYGNTGIFGALIMTRAEKDGVSKTRILAPKNAAYTDFSGILDSAPQKSSHFFDEYINKQCWKANREFSFYSKLYKPSDPTVNNEIYYGKISSDGMTLNLYTNKAMTTPYTVPTLPRPSSSNFLFPSAPQWHHVDSTNSNEVDWGFLLGGQVAGTNQGAYWATDPVAMAIMISIVRGVMHEDDGCTIWTDSDKFYPGSSGTSTAENPIYYYSQIVHDKAIGKLAYGLSFDDIFGTDPSVYYDNPNVTLTFNSVKDDASL
jgi:hypothetical protein